MKAIYVLVLSIFLVWCTQTKIPTEENTSQEVNTPIVEENNDDGGSSESSEGSGDSISGKVIDNEEDTSFEDFEDAMDKQRKQSEGLEFIGLSEEDAAALAAENNVSFRVVKRDGQYLPATMDYRPGRINAEVEDGVVTTFSVE